jgi:hypothetical protein
MKRIMLIIPLMLLNACDQSTSLNNIYEKQVKLELSGTMEIEEFKASFSNKKKQLIEEDIQNVMKKNDLSRDQLWEIYVNLFKRFAKCKDLELLSEEVEGKKGTLTYKSVDDCEKGSINIKKEIIYFVYEDGWKIDGNDIQEF